MKNLVSRKRLNYCNTDLDISVDKLYLRLVSRYLKVLVKYGLAKLNLLILPQRKRLSLPLGREPSIQAILDAPDSLDAPLESGATVGTIRIMLGERVLAESPVAVANAVPEVEFSNA